MITFIVAVLTVLLVLNCLFLILLVLVQLPKKEAGMGMAFGGAATETLFGAGSGNVLTRVTKYCAGIFMGLSLLLAIVNAHTHQADTGALDSELERLSTEGTQPPVAAPIPSTNPSTSLPRPGAAPTNLQGGLLLSTTNPAPPASTSAPVVPAATAAPDVSLETPEEP
jgi:preprotein translocase subunit SecG